MMTMLAYIPEVEGGDCVPKFFFFIFLKISTRMYTMIYDEGTHPRLDNRLDDAAPGPYQPLSLSYIHVCPKLVRGME